MEQKGLASISLMKKEDVYWWTGQRTRVCHCCERVLRSRAFLCRYQNVDHDRFRWQVKHYFKPYLFYITSFLIWTSFLHMFYWHLNISDHSEASFLVIDASSLHCTWALGLKESVEWWVTSSSNFWDRFMNGIRTLVVQSTYCHWKASSLI